MHAYSYGSNHSRPNEGDLVLMYYIQTTLQVDWTFVLCYQMVKEKWLTDFRFPYVMLTS